MKIKNYLRVENIKGLLRFNKDQIRVIKRGKSKGVDLLQYVDERYSAEKMEHILCAILDDVDYTLLLNPRMSLSRMKQLRFNMTERIDLMSDTSKEELKKVIYLT